MKAKLSRKPAALEEGLGKISRNIQMGTQYVAIVGDFVVGTLRAALLGQTGVISRLAVRQSYRGRRIGSMLIDYGENLLTHMGAKVIEIEVYGAIEQQVDFYLRMGYTELGRKDRSGEEIVLMQKDLFEVEEESDEDY
ncbi:MAG: GNAT family N-acetyltransferase [Candidatus Thorarchaeota archaeon]